MNKLLEMIKIASMHVERIQMALDGLQVLIPFDAAKIQSLTTQDLLFTDLLVHRFGKLQDILGHKILNEFLMHVDEYEDTLSMLDKIHKLERLGIIDDAEKWKEMRNLRNHVTHEYPDHPDYTAHDLNKIVQFAPVLVDILNTIKRRLDLTV